VRTKLRFTLVVLCSGMSFSMIAASSDRGQPKLQYAENVHQYLVQQAYQLLMMQRPDVQNTQMSSHIGTSEHAGPWTTGLVVAGAWREDDEDVVYGVGAPFNGWTPTSTHFWNADAGDGSKFTPPLSSPIENAYQKARVLVYGLDIWGNRRIFLYQPGPSSVFLTVWDGTCPMSHSLTSTLLAGITGTDGSTSQGRTTSLTMVHTICRRVAATPTFGKSWAGFATCWGT
jgi:hypothetical protein